jgi:enoyl-CoA hydratase/carnithine racemase
MMPPLFVEHTDQITRLTLNRPEKANALDATLTEALLAAVDQACVDGTRLLVLTGAGKHFCAGFDFSDLEAQSEGDLLQRFVRIEQVLQTLWHAPLATVALAHGSSLGAGADLVCACERRIAAPASRFRMPGLRFGLALGTRRLAARIGATAARQILATSAVFEVEAAAHMGFIDAIVAPDAWPVLTQTLGTDAAMLDPSARATLNRLTVPETRDADLADLVRSAAQPGLKARLQAFRAAAR